MAYTAQKSLRSQVSYGQQWIWQVKDTESQILSVDGGCAEEEEEEAALQVSWFMEHRDIYQITREESCSEDRKLRDSRVLEVM